MVKGLIAVAVLALAGCAHTQSSSNGCEWTRYILVSNEDVLTEGTAQQILAHNTTRQSVCSGSP